ncbi:MAG: NAD(P)-binding protein [Alphaproteobacteria bacterium]|nr:NAD(P)-binding protein [Alphaproteobacteria bacterium]
MAGTAEGQNAKRTFRRYREGDAAQRAWRESIFQASHSHKCPTYVQRTPPCQGSCPSGEDIRGWLDVVRGLDKPAAGQGWQEYAFRRLVDANPFPAVMGRVCPAPCEKGCNRNDVDDHVGINAVEQFIGDTALKEGYRFGPPAKETGKKVAVIGGGPAGLSAAYQLRRRGHKPTIIEEKAKLGGMLRYGVPRYRVPAEVLDGEIQRILDMGVEVRTNCRAGKHIGLEDLTRDYDAVFWGIGTQLGRKLPIPGANAPNCVDGIEFLHAFNAGRLSVVPQRIVVIGGGDTSIDVTTVAKKLAGEEAVAGKPSSYTADTVTAQAASGGAHVTLTTIFPLDNIQASPREVADARSLNVDLHGGVMPVEILLDDKGYARGVRYAACTLDKKNLPVRIEGGKEYEIACDMVIFAVGQKGDMAGLDALNNGRDAIAAGGLFEVAGHPGHFVGGDIVTPHLLTTAIGHGWIAAEGIDAYLSGAEPAKRPKVDKHQFDLLQALHHAGLELSDYNHDAVRGTNDAAFAVHNFENRAEREIIKSSEMFLGHFGPAPRIEREERRLSDVFARGGERIRTLLEEQAVAEAKRCMSCGLCIECDNCVVYCPQTAVKKVPKAQHAIGRYVFTDYNRCIGCHVCRDVCPTGYIQMGLGE